MLVHFMYKAVGPLVSRYGDIGLLTELFVDSVVHDLATRLQMTTQEIAAHLGRHPNWVTPIMDRIERRIAEGGLINETGLRLDLMTYLVSSFPKPRSVAEVAEHLRVADAKALNLLDALRKARLIEWEGGRYRALAQNESGNVGERKDKVLESLTIASEQGNRYTDGDPGTLFMRIQVEVAAEDAPQLLEDLRLFVRQRSAERVQNYWDRHPDGLGKTRVVKGVLTLGIEDPSSKL